LHNVFNELLMQSSSKVRQSNNTPDPVGELVAAT
jgi:hypothetical protein